MWYQFSLRDKGSTNERKDANLQSEKCNIYVAEIRLIQVRRRTNYPARLCYGSFRMRIPSQIQRTAYIDNVPLMAIATVPHCILRE